MKLPRRTRFTLGNIGTWIRLLPSWSPRRRAPIRQPRFTLAVVTLGGLVGGLVTVLAWLTLSNETAGDGIMAIFTAPRQQEHAWNAVRAAMAIHEHTDVLNHAQQPHALEIQVHMGINTGPVLLGITRISAVAGERFTYTASGEVTNLAARLCDLGNGGEIHLSQTTAQCVRKRVTLQGPFATRLKHIRDPVVVYKIKTHPLRSPVGGSSV